nr:MAG TPA: hypothetical protein [Caudoviricetes sp.]DAP66343.1 MAG TPA: hypothetical protein [Caudoviricetes sp.]DAQ60373.1 MAG TPA: hypothetical protein [Bacteriophage sp.]
MEPPRKVSNSDPRGIMEYNAYSGTDFATF